jgi:hypothetical protein
MSGTRGGSVIPSFWGRCKLNNWYKTIIKLLSLVTNFFLSRFVLFSKTQPRRPRSTPSPEATGVGRLEMQKAMPLDRQPTPPWWCSLLEDSTLVNHLFLLFLCRKCYGMADEREFCFVLLCVVNVNSLTPNGAHMRQLF